MSKITIPKKSLSLFSLPIHSALSVFQQQQKQQQQHRKNSKNSQENMILTTIRAEKLIKTQNSLILSKLHYDILYIISKEFLDILSISALRRTCLYLYITLKEESIYSEILIPINFTENQFKKFFTHLQIHNFLPSLRKIFFYESTITIDSTILLLQYCPNIQSVSLIGCKNIAIPKLTNTLVKWHQDTSGSSPKLNHFENFIVSRCVGGSRHSLSIQKINDDLDILYQGENGKKSIFHITECNNDNCEQCTLRCGACGVQYKFCDAFWIRCGWCQKKQFCGACVSDASRKNAKNYSFRFMRIKMCQLFDLICPDEPVSLQH